MARDVVGSLRGCSIEGDSFRVAADSNLSQILTRYENSRVATSGKAMRKMMKRVLEHEGLNLIVNAEEIVALKTYAEDLSDLQLSYRNAAGDEFKALGSIEVENIDTEEGRATIKMQAADEWTPFIA